MLVRPEICRYFTVDLVNLSKQVNDRLLKAKSVRTHILDLMPQLHMHRQVRDTHGVVMDVMMVYVTPMMITANQI